MGLVRCSDLSTPGAGRRWAGRWLAPAWRLAGLALAWRGRLRAAATFYERALILDPDHAATAADLAACLAALGRPQEALALCVNARRSNADSPWLLNNLGRCQAMQGDHAGAVEAYVKALARAPSLAVAWANLGASLLAMNRPRIALAAYRRALSLTPDLRVARWGEAVCLERMGYPGAATVAYNQALRVK